MIRQKREERLQREKMIRLEQEKKRQEILEKKRFRLPKIIVSQYFDTFETLDEPLAQSSNKETPGVLPNLVNIPCGSESEKMREENDAESQGSKGDRLELPELENITQEGRYVEDLAQADELHQSLLPEDENQVDATSITDANDSNSQEIDHGADVENVAVEEDGSEKVVEGDGSQLGVATEPESGVVSEDINTKIDELDIPRTEQGNIPRTEQENIPTAEKENIPNTEQEPLDNGSSEQNEQYNAANKNGEGKLEGNESEGRIEEKESEEEFQKKEREIKVDEKESEIEQEKKEIPMNFLSPPAFMADENFSDHGSIGDADDTGNFVIY